ncbi:Clp protease N-terminal domain-containing protein [Nonomuraea sp. NPDC050783]|uniref:Clp protease N-terminal domain-containing protein n=1 Tax=Nonomuraea sp. NPDC050783 TaxID=3154634 RepID=UPI003465BA33
MEGTVRLDDLISVIRSRHPDGDPLGELTDAVALGEHMGEVADHLIGHFVDQARRSGASWTDIGRSMGVSKQAAQKRFVPREGARPLAEDLRVYARFDGPARAAVVRAQQAAIAGGHEHIEPGHLLLGLADEPGAPGARTLTALGAPLDAVKDAVAAALGPGTLATLGAVDDPGPVGTSGMGGTGGTGGMGGTGGTGGTPGASGAPGAEVRRVGFAGPGKKALELTTRESLRLGHEHVGTEHLLLGVLGVLELEGGPLARALAGLGVTREGAEREIATAAAALPESDTQPPTS